MGLKIAFLGTGAMGGAILSGILRSTIDIDTIVCTTSRAESARKLQESLTHVDGAKRVSVIAAAENPEANRVAVHDADLVFLGVKPFGISDLVKEIANHISPHTAVVSLAAGITISRIEEQLPASQPVIRSMPNTPAQIGQGITGIAHNTNVSAAQVTQIIEIFEACGKVLVIEEEQMDALGAISGSGPAYVFYLLERFTKAATDLGFDEQQATTLVQGTFSGALSLLNSTDASPQQLRQQVTSPQGTTEQAIAAFEGSNLDAIIESALHAAIQRSQELAAGN